MTIAIAYIRNAVNPPELIVASDSRLSGGERWDCCRKIFPLRRGDSAIVFTGDIERFFPIISQITAFCDEHKKNYSRATALPDLFRHILDLANSLVSQISDLPSGYKYPYGTCTILLCGWNWSPKKGDNNCFIKEMKYQSKKGVFVQRRRNFSSSKSHAGIHKIIPIGDCIPAFLKEYAKLANRQTTLDMEPIEIMQKIIDIPHIDSIGGIVQCVKIYQHYNSLPITIQRNECRYLMGRRLFDWEEVSMETATYILV